MRDFFESRMASVAGVLRVATAIGVVAGGLAFMTLSTGAQPQQAPAATAAGPGVTASPPSVPKASPTVQESSGPQASARPNVLVIVADDLAFSDLGAYGGEARTPNLDGLARAGRMFARYRTSPLCSPSRAMLLTGLDNHRAGVATIPEVLPPEQADKPGYSLRLEPGATTLARRLSAIGYRTYLSGKWHLGDRSADLPNAHGFDHAFALDASGADNWRHQSYMPFYAEPPWFEDGVATRYPDGRYSSDHLVDRLIGYMDSDVRKEAPFFAYLAFQAVHIPVQAPAERSRPYADVYRDGWTAARERRIQRLNALGLRPADAPDAAPHPKLRAWANLSANEKALSSGTMAVYAGMIEAMDAAIGRLLQSLAARGALENTIIVFTSDNGPEPSDPMANAMYRLWMRTTGYRHDLDRMGETGSLLFIGPEWANAVAAPGGGFKFYTSEGGVRVPLIMAGPGVKAGGIVDANAYVTDITPTLLDMVGAPLDFPDAKSLDGRSLRPLLNNTAERVYAAGETISIEVSGNVAVVDGDLKLVHNAGPWADGVWRLFDVRQDPGETRDLAATMPNEVARLKAAYSAYVQRVGVQPMPAGYDVQAQIEANTNARLQKRFGPIVLGIAGVLALVAGLGFVLWRRRRQRSEPA